MLSDCSSITAAFLASQMLVVLAVILVWSCVYVERMY